MKRREEDHREIQEGVELLELWYRRWQGSLATVTPEMAIRTREFVERNGGSIPHPAFVASRLEYEAAMKS